MGFKQMAETSLMPVAKQQFFDNNGDPLASGNVYFYETGTTTEKTVYSDSNGNVALSNPVTLDSAGRASIWLDGYYKVVVKDSNGATVYTTDNISSQYSQSITSVQFVDQDDVLTYISATQFSVPNNLTSTYEIGRRFKAVVTAGTVYGTITNVTAGGSPVITTVTVNCDSGNLDSGLSAIALGILTSSNQSIPVVPLDTKTANYTLLGTDLNKKIVMNANGGTLTVPTANNFPSGFEFEFVNIGSNQMELTGTINGFANVTFLQYESAQVFGDGSNWYSQNMHNQDPVGTIKWWHKSLSGVPQTLPWGWMECTGQTISDAESPIDGQTLPNINGDGRFIRGSNTSGNEQANQNLEHLHNNTLVGTGTKDIPIRIDNDLTSSYYLTRQDANGSVYWYTSGVAQLSDNSIANLSVNSNDIAANLTLTNANSGNTESRPDNISMVAIIKTK